MRPTQQQRPLHGAEHLHSQVIHGRGQGEAGDHLDPAHRGAVTHASSTSPVDPPLSSDAPVISTETAPDAAAAANPPLPTENPPTEVSPVVGAAQHAPPLPAEIPPTREQSLLSAGASPSNRVSSIDGENDDGWYPVWSAEHAQFYFMNRFHSGSQWENPRVPVASGAPAMPPPPGLGAYDPNDRGPSTHAGAPGTSSSTYGSSSPQDRTRVAGGYDPRIHGNYDPNADYAIRAQQEAEAQEQQVQYPPGMTNVDPSAYAVTGYFNRFTGKFQDPNNRNPENYNDENKSNRQLNAFFDAHAAANSHDGRSLKAERAAQRVSKKDLKKFKAKAKAKKEEKQKAWLRD
ncbi:hypothetical protein K402DRAFT_174252 [Aulographum hederae CBS 113979]|uniref:WW domain-containing protein n=1 Tax=Aulographum hederae CBS 113979 TaxID=1176131 RepID=A0A6G1HEA6_9PEZI|nr:hypothetical protein K402DRAFT_174252 [Aulographum hederae CBS 113979]